MLRSVGNVGILLLTSVTNDTAKSSMPGIPLHRIIGGNTVFVGTMSGIDRCPSRPQTLNNAKTSHTITSRIPTSGSVVAAVLPAALELNLRLIASRLSLRDISFRDHRAHMKIVTAVNGSVTAQ